MITAIIPTLNEEEFIEDCLIALKNQTYPIDEIIVIDSGSTDRTVEIARKYAKVIFGKPSMSYNRELGIQVARNNIILSTDGDTILPPNWLENAIKHLNGTGGVFGKIYPINPNLISRINCWFRNLDIESRERGCCFLFKKSGEIMFESNGHPRGKHDIRFLKKHLEGEIIYDKNLIAYTDITESLQVKTFFLLGGAGVGVWLLLRKL